MSRRRTTVTLVAASVLLTVAALTACSGPTPPAPTTAPTRASAPASAAPGPTTPAPSPTWPPQVALPTPPPEMARDDEAGAIAAATYFLTELYPYTVASHDTSAWREMSHTSCGYCSGIVDAVTSEDRAGTRTTAGIITVTDTSAEQANPETYGVKVTFIDDHDVQRGPEGTLVREFPPQYLQLGVLVVWQADRWLIRGVDVLSSSDSP